MKRYRVARGVWIPPRGLMAAPGGLNMRLEEGAEFTLEDRQVDRFIRRSRLNGDIEEVAVTPEKKGKTS